LLSPRNVARADIIGDVGVLLAQLEQQLQLVSNAIRTVQGVVQTVNHLSNIVTMTKVTLQKARQGGLEGLLESAQNYVQYLRGINGNLMRLDATAAQWRNKIIGLANTVNPSANDQIQAAIAVRELDKQRLQNAQAMNDATNQLVKDSNDAFTQTGDILNESQTTDGVVGQIQELQKINAQQMRVALNQQEMTAQLVKNNNDELVRMAAKREAERQAVERLMTGYGEIKTSVPSELQFNLQQPWQ
jgi:DNA repair exonuclease SbcCD ATPase subunit